MRFASLLSRPAIGLTILLLSASALDAQTMLGVRGGVSVASVDLDIDQTFDDSNRTGFVGGVFLDFGGGDSPLGFQIGAQYSQKGAELDIGNTVSDLSLDYLEFPAVVKLGLPLRVIKPSVFGGVGLGFNTSCERENDGDCDDEVKSTEFSGILGADVVFYLGGINLFVDGRYHFGLNDISDSVDFDELKNRAWQLQAGLGFPLGG